MIDRLFDDTLWIYTAIIGSVIGAVFVAYMRTTRIGIAFYSRVDSILDALVDRYGFKFLRQDENAWRKKYPHVRSKIDELENTIERLEENE